MYLFPEYLPCKLYSRLDGTGTVWNSHILQEYLLSSHEQDWDMSTYESQQDKDNKLLPFGTSFNKKDTLPSSFSWAKKEKKEP